MTDEFGLEEFEEFEEFEEVVEEEQPPAPKRRKRRKRSPPVCTNTGGNALTKNTRATIARVLDRPVEAGYALVYCQELGVGITRFGKRLPSATFTLFTLDADDPGKEFRGESGRNEAITGLLRMLSEGWIYGPPDELPGQQP